MIELCYNTMNWSPYLMAKGAPSLPDQITAAASAGFRYFGADAGSIDAYCANGGSPESLAEAIAAAGMQSFELPTLMIGANSAANQAAAEHLVGLAGILKPQFVQLNIDCEIDKSTIDDLRQAGEMFAAAGVRLAIEYLPWLPAVRNINTTREVLAKAAVEGAGVLVDIWHFSHSDDSFNDLESLPLAELAYVQFNDHPALASEDLFAETIARRAMPGRGVLELDRFASVCKSKGYDGVVSCEVLSVAAQAMAVDDYAREVFCSSRPYWEHALE